MNLRATSLEDAGLLARFNRHFQRLHKDAVPNHFKAPSPEKLAAAFTQGSGDFDPLPGDDISIACYLLSDSGLERSGRSFDGRSSVAITKPGKQTDSKMKEQVSL